MPSGARIGVKLYSLSISWECRTSQQPGQHRGFNSVSFNPPPNMESNTCPIKYWSIKEMRHQQRKHPFPPPQDNLLLIWHTVYSLGNVFLSRRTLPFILVLTVYKNGIIPYMAFVPRSFPLIGLSRYNIHRVKFTGFSIEFCELWQNMYLYKHHHNKGLVQSHHPPKFPGAPCNQPLPSPLAHGND